MRRWVAAALCAICPAATAQQAAIAPVRPSGGPLRSYQGVEVPPARESNSARIRQLVRAGTLYLTRQDAIALALENNIDLEIARYGPILAEWNLERAQAGGALPGVPRNASQAGAVAAGQGVAGSQAAAGVRIGAQAANANATANASISQVGPVTQNLDPTIQEASTFSHTSTPQANNVQSVTQVLISRTRATSASFQQGFLSGGSVTLAFNNNYLNENSPTDVLNPSSAPNISLSVQHNLLRGFGTGVNGRTITVARMNVNTSEVSFRGQVISVVSQVLNAYYSLAASDADLKSRRSAADAAETLYKNVQRQVSLGTQAPIDLVNAETQMVTTRQAVVDAEAARAQNEVQLKNLLSRVGTADPDLAAVHILPLDTIAIPPQDNLPPLEDMVRQALANRTDIGVTRANLQAAEISALGTRNGLLPSLQAFGALTQSGLGGTPRTVSAGGFSETPDEYFVGGLGTALGQVLRRNFPTERGGAVFSTTIRNWQAQADYAIDQLQLRQSDLNLRKSLNQVQVDVLNSVVALQQARARYDAAVKNVALQQELLRGEQQKYSLGASTPYNVVVQQRDLVAAQSAEISALVTYSGARIGLDRTLGTTLETNGVSIAEARGGTVARPPDPVPAVPPQP